MLLKSLKDPRRGHNKDVICSTFMLRVWSRTLISALSSPSRRASQSPASLGRALLPEDPAIRRRLASARPTPLSPRRHLPPLPTEV